MFGAGKWQADDTQALVNLKTVIQVYVVPDNDKPGLDHATAVAAEIQRVKIPVTIVPLPNLGPEGDISNWFNAGGTVKKLEALTATPPYGDADCSSVESQAPKQKPPETTPHTTIFKRTADTRNAPS
jgi:hypothetical protein